MSFVPALLALFLTTPTNLDSDNQDKSDDVPFWAAPFRLEPGQQVRIEQRITIRISPRRPGASAAAAPIHRLRLEERSMGRCISVGAIGAVQVSDANRLLLYLRDQRLVSASLERACSARDFYSGFYLERHPDGNLCIDRDVLLSRSGANCKLSRIRQLVVKED